MDQFAGAHGSPTVGKLLDDKIGPNRQRQNTTDALESASLPVADNAAQWKPPDTRG
jgi:hypothetical protein